ncbi:MAG: tyrosine recombinase XerC [Clostridia bacterium]|nr:tyrosine recombinase XerC [Clostridia bacterium]
MDRPELLVNFENYLSHLNRSKLTISQYDTDLVMFLQYVRAEKVDPVPSEELLREQTVSDMTARDLCEIDRDLIFRFLRYVSEERGNKPAARARKLSAIKMFFRYLTEVKEVLPANPAAAISAPKIDKRLPKYLSLDESRDLLEAVDGDDDSKYRERDYCIITLFLNCGMRLAELVGINLSDMDRSYTKLRVIGKGNKERIIYLNDASRDAILAYLAVRGQSEIKDKNALFISRLGKRVSRQTVQHIVYKYLARAGLDFRHLSVHKLRHTAATLMYREGHVDVRVLKEILGHEQLNTTQIYTHVSSEQMRSAMDQNPLAEMKGKKKK